MMYRKKPGYILVLSLILIFLSMFLVTYLANRGSVFVPYAMIAIERKQAYMLAQSGLDLAISQIVSPKVSKKQEQQEGQKKKKPTEQELDQDMLTVILPTLNRWQEVKLTQKVEGIDATIKFCIMCENGKFDLNALYDFDKHQFINPGKDADTKKMFNELFEKIKKIMGGKELFGAFETILKEKKYRLNDPTELLTRAFEPFKDAVFYEPPDKDSPKKRPIYLTDLFTVWTGKRSINPWLLSDSVAAVMDLKRAQIQDVAERKKGVAQWLKQFKLKSQWQTDWNKLLKPLYGKEFNSVPKSLQPFLSGTFEARVFSILSYATVGRVTQRLLAIVERPSTGDSSDMTIKKVYWL